MKKILTTKEISNILGVSEESVRRWIRTKELKAKQEGKSYLVDESDLYSFIHKKEKDGASTSIGKLATILPVIGSIAGVTALSTIQGLISSKISNDKNKAPSKLSIEEIDKYISELSRKKQKLTLEYQMELLELEEEIDLYEKLKLDLNNKK